MEKKEMDKMMGEKIKKLLREGKSQAQSVAMALAMARESKKKK